jgi:hypothetical protein
LPELGQDAESRRLVRLNKIIVKACRADSGRRYQTADELMADLVNFDAGEEPDPAREQLRRRLVLLLEILGLLIAGGVIVALLWQLIRLLRQT